MRIDPIISGTTQALDPVLVWSEYTMAHPSMLSIGEMLMTQGRFSLRELPLHGPVALGPAEAMG